MGGSLSNRRPLEPHSFGSDRDIFLFHRRQRRRQIIIGIAQKIQDLLQWIENARLLVHYVNQDRQEHEAWTKEWADVDLDALFEDFVLHRRPLGLPPTETVVVTNGDNPRENARGSFDHILRGNSYHSNNSQSQRNDSIDGSPADLQTSFADKEFPRRHNDNSEEDDDDNDDSPPPTPADFWWKRVKTSLFLLTRQLEDDRKKLLFLVDGIQRDVRKVEKLWSRLKLVGNLVELVDTPADHHELDFEFPSAADRKVFELADLTVSGGFVFITGAEFHALTAAEFDEQLETLSESLQRQKRFVSVRLEEIERLFHAASSARQECDRLRWRIETALLKRESLRYHAQLADIVVHEDLRHRKLLGESLEAMRVDVERRIREVREDKDKIYFWFNVGIREAMEEAMEDSGKDNSSWESGQEAVEAVEHAACEGNESCLAEAPKVFLSAAKHFELNLLGLHRLLRHASVIRDEAYWTLKRAVDYGLPECLSGDEWRKMKRTIWRFRRGMRRVAAKMIEVVVVERMGVYLKKLDALTHIHDGCRAAVETAVNIDKEIESRMRFFQYQSFKLKADDDRILRVVAKPDEDAFIASTLNRLDGFVEKWTRPSVYFLERCGAGDRYLWNLGHEEFGFAQGFFDLLKLDQLQRLVRKLWEETHFRMIEWEQESRATEQAIEAAVALMTPLLEASRVAKKSEFAVKAWKVDQRRYKFRNRINDHEWKREYPARYKCHLTPGSAKECVDCCKGKGKESKAAEV